MLVILKTVHILALMAGGAASIGNGMLLSRLLAEGGPPPAMVARHMAILGRVGRWAVTLLWITGLPMAFWVYGTLALGAVFYLKLLAATVMLVAVMWIGRVGAAAARAGRPPDFKRMKTLANVVAGGALVAVVTAVIVFN